VYCGKYGFPGADAMELDGKPGAGYGSGDSPKTTPSVKAAIAVHNTRSAMLKYIAKPRLSHLNSVAKLLSVKCHAAVIVKITFFWVVTPCS
jgi:hypothetical protein